MALTLVGIIMWDVVLIVSTEYMITRNNVASGEGNWTFSQTLALGVLGVPLWDVVSNIRRGIEEDKPRGACNCTGVEDKREGHYRPYLKGRHAAFGQDMSRGISRDNLQIYVIIHVSCMCICKTIWDNAVVNAGARDAYVCM